MAKTSVRLCFLVFSILLSCFAFGHAKSLSTDLAQKLNAETQEAWPWGDRTKFKCPSMHGVFANVDDCSSFFLCVAGISSKRSCPRLTQFDKYHKKCLSIFIAICDKGDSTTESPKTTKGKGTTKNNKGTTKSDKKSTVNDRVTTVKDSFTCPSVWGSHTHPTDCSKYYSCTIFIPTLKSCPDGELFDGVKLTCKPAKDVNCGSRTKATETTILTTQPITKTTTSLKPETTTSLKPETTTSLKPLTTTPEPTTTTTPEPTTPEPTTTTTPTPTTTPEPTTTPKPTIPETDCDENDLDCIIDDTGVTPDWFTCPEDIGSYPHPVSKKLFIFCLNWEPSVKKCGQDLVYSNVLRTCVDP